MFLCSSIPNTKICFFISATNIPFSSSPNPPFLLRFRTSHRENLRYLKSLGIIKPGNKTYKNPSPESLSQILSIVNLLNSQGFSEADISRIALVCNQVFLPVFSPAHVESVFEFFKFDLAATPEDTRGLILRCPQILESNVPFCLRPTLIYLKELDIGNLNLPTTLNAHLLNTRVDKLEEKVRFLQGIGFSYEESAKFCARFPAIFGYSIEHNLWPKYVYLVEEMRRDIQELKLLPQYFAFSLRNRIVPRHLHLKERNVTVPLKRMLLWSDQRFYAKWK
ncbi:transcription termination factor MTEF1, chloroplastic [Nicotiana tomentosiformis]|uniref:Transcription termination factor MTEF1, chloroplastic-like n=1 Tax=Nicotiana tabacum TaxID=4097 RepID=A0A1S3X2U6_TOBAC|nr:transcription termination factor MTEF1, chloroplastic [Nicotiana tomentosiformis]XP_016434146.1 PREDICTED: uncharacterized protein LOC107760589 [Nicotiana tabacum]